MSDYKSMNDYHLSTHDQLMRENERQRDLIAKLETDKIDLAKRHIELENSLIELRKYHKEVEGYAARVYDPNKSTYKELEDKLALAENSKQAEIDELYETKIALLQNEIKDKKIQLESAYKQDIRNMEEIGHLKNRIENLKMTINYAAGYISSCEQFRDKHPNYVKDWLFQGIKQ